MQIVIEIPEWIYRRIQDIGLSDYPIINGTANAIRHGTVLPEHGRLIDADSLIKQTTERICEKCDRRRGMKDGKLTKRFVYEIGDALCRACGIGDMHEYLEDAPTILETWGNEE